jgi:hypothetical protein
VTLHVRLTVNGDVIGHISVQRINPPVPTDDTICVYAWAISDNWEFAVSGTALHHRYGDGPWSLIAKVIVAAGLHGEPNGRRG